MVYTGQCCLEIEISSRVKTVTGDIHNNRIYQTTKMQKKKIEHGNFKAGRKCVAPGDDSVLDSIHVLAKTNNLLILTNITTFLISTMCVTVWRQ